MTDLEALCHRFEEHIQRLLHTPPDALGIVRAHTVWVPQDLAMELSCGLGGVEHEAGGLTGEFDLLAMLNIIPDHGRSAGVYAGFRANVDVAEVAAFCTAVRSYLVEELS